MAAKKQVKATLAKVDKTPSPLALMKEASKQVTAGLQSMAAMLSKDLPPATAISIYHLVDKEWKKPIEDIREFARHGLLDFLEEQTEKGETEVEYGGNKYRAKRRPTFHSLPDEASLADLLEKRGRKLQDVQRQVVSFEVDMGKVEALIKEGVLTAEELNSLRKQKSVSLVVEKI